MAHGRASILDLLRTYEQMKARLSARTIHVLSPRDKPFEVVDTDLKGFLLRVQPSGAMTYYYSYRNKQGKRLRYRIGNQDGLSPAQARDAALLLSARVIAGEDIQAEKKRQRLAARQAKSRTLAGFLDRKYGPWVRRQRKTGEATIDRILANFEHLLERPLSEINVWVVEKWQSESIKAGKAKSTVNRDVAALKACLSKAIEWELLSAHPLASLRPLRTDRRSRVRYLTREEERRLRDALIHREEDIRRKRENANQWRRQRQKPELPNLSDYGYADHLYPMALLALNTGLRRGEIFQLQWSDVDLLRKQITVRGRTAKSGQTRHVPLNEEARQALQRWGHYANNVGYVFPGKHSGPLTTIHSSWRSALELAKISDFRWHDLRHHFASRLVMEGVDLNTVRELLGHSDLEMTLRYAHLSPGHMADAVARLDACSDNIHDAEGARAAVK